MRSSLFLLGNRVYGNLSSQMFSNNGDSRPLQRMSSNLQQGQPESRRLGTKLRRYKSDVADEAAKVLSPLDAHHSARTNASMTAARLAEEWLKLQRRIDLWVAIEELTEDGTYKKVSVTPAADVKTGGIYQLRQGLNRRIRIFVRANELTKKERGVLPVECEAVTQVSVGCISRISYEPGSSADGTARLRSSPDSYQEADLERLRQRWCEAMDKWQSYLQTNLQTLAKKEQKSSLDEAREGYLLNRWVSSIQERDAILVPPAGSGLPGAPASGNPPAGMEYHNSLLFVDLQSEGNQLNQNLWVGANSYLDGEETAIKEGRAFVTLPMIKRYATLIGAVASWDTNLHDDSFLNKITPAGERIYLIVCVHILLSKPTLMTLVLRKRICINICRRNPIANIFRSPFSRMVNTEKISRNYAPNATLYTDQEDNHLADTTETYAEQYMRTIQAVNSELYLDGLRQEVALQEALSTQQNRRQSAEINALAYSTNKISLQRQNVTKEQTSSAPTNAPCDEEKSKIEVSAEEKGATSPSSSLKRPPLMQSSDTGVPLRQPIISNPVANESELRRLLDGFKVDRSRLGTKSQPMNSHSVEENMAWTRREREKLSNSQK
ncbi:unnamed protein product [Schistocephalus solidus]|uniref:DUF3694 domain-containing protein n=1 Tax=Schistocephalus solidus TaxID=70667 RepID=A0A183SFH0_SCHSO|nr:unnamed protein product [Schistocephalus solidus]